MQSDEKYISDIVRKIVGEIEKQSLSSVSRSNSYSGSNGIYDDVNSAVEAAKIAQKKWIDIPKTDKEKIIAALRECMHSYAEDFSRRAVDETGMGRVKDKIIKHHNAATHTPGLEDLETKSWSGAKGLVYEDYAPFGVVAAVTPSTHPVPVLFNSMVMIIAAGNSVVFNVHPSAKKLSAYALEKFNEVIYNNGGPKNLVTMLREPTIEGAEQLFSHPDVKLIVATGGPSLVKAAFKAGKKVVAAGPGNPPVLVDETADIPNAVKCIIEGGSFDNNILCIAEKEVLVVEKVFDKFMDEMERQGSVRLLLPQIKALGAQVFSVSADNVISINREFIGKNASVLARAIGINISDEVRLLYGECETTCKWMKEEQMMPFMPVLRVSSFEEGVELSVKYENGYGHTAVIHSKNIDNITRFTKALDVDIVVVNGSSLAGLGGNSGEGYFSHTIASPTGEGICTPRNFARVRRLAIANSMQIT